MKVAVCIFGVLLAGGAVRQSLAQNQASTDSVPVVVMKSGRRIDGAARATVAVGGKPVPFEGITFYQVDGKLFVPLRSIGEVLGASISYDAASRTITAIRAGRTLRLRGGTLMRGLTFVPLRAISEGLGVQVTVTQVPNLLQIALNPSPWSEEARVSQRSGSREAPAVSLPLSSAGGNAVEVSQANIQYNLTQLNALRKKAGVPVLQLDAKLSAFALQGSLELMRTHEPHGHFKAADIWSSGFDRAAAENQGDPHGWFPGDVNRSIDEILRAMISEGPGGGHHDNILNRAYKRVGIGLVKDRKGRLYLTNDFSG